MARNKTELDIHASGLILMIIFTMGWVISSIIFFGNPNYNAVGIVFGIAIIFLAYNYIKFKIGKKRLSVPPLKNGKKKGKWYSIVVLLEMLAIFVTVNILATKGQGHLIISSIALIVGLHFLPMAKIFNRKFDYYIGLWTIIIALTGLLLISMHRFDYKMVNALVCIGCALSTTAYGLKMVNDGNQLMRKYKK